MWAEKEQDCVGYEKCFYRPAEKVCLAKKLIRGLYDQENDSESLQLKTEKALETKNSYHQNFVRRMWKLVAL